MEFSEAITTRLFFWRVVVESLALAFYRKGETINMKVFPFERHCIVYYIERGGKISCEFI